MPYCAARSRESEGSSRQRATHWPSADGSAGGLHLPHDLQPSGMLVCGSRQVKACAESWDPPSDPTSSNRSCPDRSRRQCRCIHARCRSGALPTRPAWCRRWPQAPFLSYDFQRPTAKDEALSQREVLQVRSSPQRPKAHREHVHAQCRWLWSEIRA